MAGSCTNVKESGTLPSVRVHGCMCCVCMSINVCLYAGMCKCKDVLVWSGETVCHPSVMLCKTQSQ